MTQPVFARGGHVRNGAGGAAAYCWLPRQPSASPLDRDRTAARGDGLVSAKGVGEPLRLSVLRSSRLALTCARMHACMRSRVGRQPARQKRTAASVTHTAINSAENPRATGTHRCGGPGEGGKRVASRGNGGWWVWGGLAWWRQRPTLLLGHRDGCGCQPDTGSGHGTWGLLRAGRLPPPRVRAARA